MRIDREKLVMPAMLAGTLGVFLVGFGLPHQRKMAQKRQEIAATQELIRAGQDDAADLARFTVEEDLEAAVPARAGLGPLLEQMSQALAAETVEEQQIQAKTTVQGSDFHRIPLTLRFMGSIDAVMGLLHWIESNERIIRVDRLDITLDTEQIGRVLLVDIGLSTFFHAAEGGAS